MNSRNATSDQVGHAAAHEAAPGGGTDHSRWFAEEVHAHDGQLRAYLRGSFPTVRDVDDVVQESYLRVWKARAARPIQSAKAFLFKVARHVALDRVQREKTSMVSAVEDLDLLPVTEEQGGAIGANEKVRLVADALVVLPPRCREIVMLRKLKGASRRDVAEQLGISEKTVDEQLARGVKRMEDYFRQHGVRRHDAT